MQLTFTKAHNLSQLHDEILALYPDLKDALRVEGRDDGFIRLTLPDGVNDPGLTTLVAAHVPAPTQPDPVTAAQRRLKLWVRDPLAPAPNRDIVLDLIRATHGA